MRPLDDRKSTGGDSTAERIDGRMMIFSADIISNLQANGVADVSVAHDPHPLNKALLISHLVSMDSVPA
jgi:hypothetical protein